MSVITIEPGTPLTSGNLPSGLAHSDGELLRVQECVLELQASGCTLIFEHKTDEHVVKLREKGHRQIRSGSTSGYPFLDVWQQWHERQSEIGIVDFHLMEGEEVLPAGLLRHGWVLGRGGKAVGYKYRQGGDAFWVTDPSVFVGLENVYLLVAEPVAVKHGGFSTLLPRVRVIKPVNEQEAVMG